jgi:hypothetical protein
MQLRRLGWMEGVGGWMDGMEWVLRYAPCPVPHYTQGKLCERVATVGCGLGVD